jgi:outer membrane protein assembly factor BamA
MYLPAAYRKGLERIVDLYRSRGFLSARAGPPELVWRRDGSRLVVRIPVEEGTQTLIGALGFEGNDSIAAADLLRLAEVDAESVRPGGPFDPNAVENLRRRLLQNYADRGFAYARVESRVQFSPDRELADVTLAVDEGPRVEVRRILLSGNQRTARSVFDHSLELRRGGRFTPKKVAASTENLLSLGVFSGTEIRLLDPDRVQEQKDVLVFVRERPANNLTLIPGISSAEGVRLEIGYTHLNLFGRALELATRLRVNRPVFYPLMPPGLEERYQNMSFVEGLEGFALAGLHWPRAWWLGANAGVRLDLAAVQEHAASFDLTRFSLTPGLDLHLGGGVDLTLQLDLERIGFDCSVANQSCGAAAGDRWNRYDEGSLFLAGFRTEIVWDRRDNPFRPRRGALLSFRPEIDKSLSSSREAFFARLDLLASVYFPLARDLTLAVSLRGGAIVQFLSGSKTPSHKLFFLGGRNSVRGYREDALIPADLDPPCIEIPGAANQTECISPGGNAYVNAKIELRFPLVPGRLEAAVFSDGGNLWIDPKRMDPFEIRPAGGFGLRWVTPVGPVAFDFGFNLDPDPARHEDTWNLHFNIGEF